MAKKDISKTLAQGSIKQRLLLLAEDTARGKHFQERLLTPEDRERIYDSIRKPNELRLLREFEEADDTVTNSIINLQGLLFELKMHNSNLRGYIISWYTTEGAELMVNSILHEIKDPQERKRIAQAGAKNTDLLFIETEVDQEGYLDLKVEFQKETYTDEQGKKISWKDKPRMTTDFSLLHVINNVRAEVVDAFTRYISWERAILDFMEDRGFNVKTYKKVIENLGNQARQPITGWSKYYGQVNTGIQHPRIERIISRYDICPDLEEIQVDIEQYAWFRKYFLDRGYEYPDELRGKVNTHLHQDEQEN